MKKAVWFSRHTISNEQRAEITARGYQLVAEAEGKTLGSVALRDEEDVRIVLNGLRSLGVDAIFGVFAAPIQAALSVMGQSADDEDMAGCPYSPRGMSTAQLRGNALNFPTANLCEWAR